MNRLNRDEILMRALDLIDSSSLDQKDRPLGTTIQQQALSISWLQDGLDFFHRKFPWTGLIQTASYTFTPGSLTYTLPTNFTLDVRNGVRIMQPQGTGDNVKRRLLRKPLTWLLTRDTTTDATGCPRVYCILGRNLRIYPNPDKAYSNGELWYYSLPTPLDADDVPTFPDDWTLIEYIRLRGREWTGEDPPGSALTYCNAIVAQLQSAGLGNEADNDALDLDPSFFHPQGAESSHQWYGWMGNPVLSN